MGAKVGRLLNLEKPNCPNVSQTRWSPLSRIHKASNSRHGMWLQTTPTHTPWSFTCLIYRLCFESRYVKVMESSDINPMSVWKQGFLQISRFKSIIRRRWWSGFLRGHLQRRIKVWIRVNTINSKYKDQVQQPWQQQQQEPKETTHWNVEHSYINTLFH